MNVRPPDQDTPLLAWLIESLQTMSRTRIKEWLRDGRVSINGESVRQFDAVVQPGDQIRIGDRPQTAPQTPPIVYEDEHLIVINKPAGLLTVATETEKGRTAFVQLNAALEARSAGRVWVVHRLDRETSGVLLFARSPAVRDQLQAMWPSIEKTYLTLVEGTPTPPEGVIETHLIEGRDLRVRTTHRGEGKPARTRYRTLETRGRYSLLEVGLETGRKHQIRVHLASIGCPVAGDPTYGAKTNPGKRLSLHAWRIVLTHPISGQRIETQVDCRL